MRRVLLAAVLVAACGRPEIDPAPYRHTCASFDAGCPSPYECIDDFGCQVGCDAGARPACFVRCSDDQDCPPGFFCNDVTQGMEGTPSHVCTR